MAENRLKLLAWFLFQQPRDISTVIGNYTDQPGFTHGSSTASISVYLPHFTLKTRRCCMQAGTAVLSSILLMSLANAQSGHKPIRLCVSSLENVSRLMVTSKWQQSQLIRAFERLNKGKDVVKGKAARIDTVALGSTDRPDPDVRGNDCEFVLHTT